MGSGGRTVREAVLIPEGRQFESPDRHVKNYHRWSALEQGIEPLPWIVPWNMQGLAVNKYLDT